jgi:hypothetical protein
MQKKSKHNNSSNLTGTILDRYLNLLEPIALFGKTLKPEHQKELWKATNYLEENFNPGEENGMPNSMFVSWLYFDFRFGKSQKTVCERFIASNYFESLNDEDKILIWHMSSSYNAFYDVMRTSKSKVTFKELYNNQIFHAIKLNQLFEESLDVGEILYERFLGTSEKAYMYTPPFIYPSTMKLKLTEAIRKHKQIFIEENPSVNFPKEDILKEAYKKMLPTWMQLILNL